GFRMEGSWLGTSSRCFRRRVLASSADESVGTHSLNYGVLMPRFDHLELDSPHEDSGARKSVQVDSQDEKHWLRMAEENRRQGLYDNALRFYSRALELDKSLVLGWLGQVQMLVAQGEYPEAELWSRKGLELFRNNGDLMAGRAQALCRMGDTKQAH